jgi:1-acyl-sn-glycerol-3-phosphate acyltransferase
MHTPNIDQRTLSGFHWFIPRYLRKHFHSVAIHQQGLRPAELTPQDSLVIYANHASWWDPLLALYLAKRLFSDFRFYAPIDATALQKYRVFGRIGFFPVEMHSLSGARHFLQVSQEVLGQPGSSIWITPEGRFADVRDHTAPLLPGLAHLARAIHQGVSDQQSRVWFMPIALEYTFWEERLPETLVCFGDPILITSPEAELSKSQWQERITAGLRSTQARLASDSIARNPQVFDVLLSGQSGTSGVYDLWRRMYARMRGKQLDLEHGNKLRGN